MTSKKINGYTFIEVVITLAFVLLTFVPLIRVLTYITLSSSEITNKVKAINLARADLEYLKSKNLTSDGLANYITTNTCATGCLNPLLTCQNPFNDCTYPLPTISMLAFEGSPPDRSFKIDGISFDMIRACDPISLHPVPQQPRQITIKVYLKTNRTDPAVWGIWKGAPIVTLVMIYNKPA